MKPSVNRRRWAVAGTVAVLGASGGLSAAVGLQDSLDGPASGGLSVAGVTLAGQPQRPAEPRRPAEPQQQSPAADAGPESADSANTSPAGRAAGSAASGRSADSAG